MFHEFFTNNCFCIDVWVNKPPVGQDKFWSIASTVVQYSAHGKQKCVERKSLMFGKHNWLYSINWKFMKQKH